MEALSPEGAKVGDAQLELRVTAMRYLADTIHEIELSAPDGRLLPRAQAGAHIDLHLTEDLTRSYSLTNGPEDQNRYVIGVSRDPNSRGGSAHVIEKLRLGQTIKVGGPRNAFAMAVSQEAAFVAGGIGITPILSMIRARVAMGQSWSLLYAFRNRAAAAYLPQLEALAQRTGGLLILHDDSQATTHPDLAAYAAGFDPQCHLYCCGPAPMIAAFQAACSSRASDCIHVEHFSNTFEASANSFKVILKRKGLEIDVPAGRTIMDYLQEAGVRVNYACREGVCGTCETRVVEGTPDHNCNVLSAREKASGKVMMICCSGAKTDRLVLDI